MNRIAILINASQEGANEYIPIICVWTLQITSYCEGLLLELDLCIPLVQPWLNFYLHAWFSLMVYT